MSNCCSNKPESNTQPCPQCGVLAKNIKNQTIYHHVKFPDVLEANAESYCYCANDECSIAYFSQQGKIFNQNQLREYEQLTKKLCYCFDINTEQYIDALKQKTAEPIKNFVIEKTKAGDCACVARNPSGQCCLAAFKQLEKEFVDNQNQ